VAEVFHEWSADSGTEKAVNIKLAIEHLNRVVILPDQVFSFWRTIGRPVARNGFVKSRAIVNGKTMQDYGGGLCQVSGMLFHLAILAGMEIIERSSHSIDIYREEERHTPLGLDATVSFCIKDLVFQNKTCSTIQFEFSLLKVENKYIFSGKTLSCKPIEARQVKIDRFDMDGRRFAMTKVYAGDQLERELRSQYVIGCP
jgi:vancomycin resistance protein VanW